MMIDDGRFTAAIKEQQSIQIYTTVHLQILTQNLLLKHTDTSRINHVPVSDTRRPSLTRQHTHSLSSSSCI